MLCSQPEVPHLLPHHLQREGISLRSLQVPDPENQPLLLKLQLSRQRDLPPVLSLLRRLGEIPQVSLS